MNKTFLIFRHELYTLARSKFFWLAVLFPLLVSLGLFVGPLVQQIFNPAALFPEGDSQELMSWLFDRSLQGLPQGFIDQAGLVSHYPPGLDPRRLIKYADESQARQALRAGQISSYTVIPGHFLNSSVLMKYVPARDSAWLGLSDEDLTALLAYNLAGADPERIAIVKKPIAELQEINLSPQQERLPFDRDDPIQTQVIALTAMCLFMVLLMPLGLLTNGLSRENENSVLEVLLSSASTEQIARGKVAGLGFGGLIMLCSLLTGVNLFILCFGRFMIGGMQRLTPGNLIWVNGVILGGYLLFGVLMAAAGLLLPGMSDSSLSGVVMVPCMLVVFLYQLILDQPHNPIMIALSLFPLTSPTTMVMRLMSAPVPLWQLIACLALNLILVVGIVKAAAALLRAQSLLTGVTLPQIFRHGPFYWLRR